VALLVDTGPIVALMDRSAPQHKFVLEWLTSTSEPCVTCEAVIAESCHVLRGLQGAASDLLKDIARKQFEIPYRLADRSVEVSRLMKKYSDVPMDLADACMVDLANLLRTGRILTLDSDFRIYRWGRAKEFELLLDLD
jgi:predicted nucleic acid-binding protein